MSKIILFSISFLMGEVLISQHINAQVISKIDSLQKVLVSQKEDSSKESTLAYLNYYYWLTNDYKRTMQTAEQDLALSTKINYKPGKANAYLNIGLAYGIKKERLKEVEYLKNTLAYSLQIKDTQHILKTYDFITEMYGEQLNDYGKALENAYAAQRIREKSGNKAVIAEGHFYLAVIYSTVKNYSQVLKNAYAALNYYKETKNISRTAACYGIISTVHYNKNELSQSLDFAFEELKVLANSNDSSGIGEAYRSIAFINLALGDSAVGKNLLLASRQYRIAKNKFLLSLEFERPMLVKANIAYCYLGIGATNLRLANFKTAQKYLDSSLFIFKLLDSKQGFQKVYSCLAKLDSATGNFKGAFQNYKFSVEYGDSINMEESNRKAVQAQMQYDFDKKEMLAKSAQDKKDSIEKRFRRQQYIVISALAVTVLCALIIALVQLRSNQQKQKANILISNQKQKVEKTLAELRAAQAQLIQAEKMASLGELTAGIAHEIQNPLNFVNNFSEINTELLNELLQETNDGNLNEVRAIANDIFENSKKINHHGKRADEIVKGMLEHSRGRSGTKEITDINKLANDYLKFAYNAVRAKDKAFHALLTTNFDTASCNIITVTHEIARVLLNLYNNAFYSINEKAKQVAKNYEPLVTVSTKTLYNNIELRVGDNGNGIPKKVLDKIFQPFFTTKPTGQGTGLGLSLSYDIIKSLGGTITVETIEGEGTTFIIQLPLTENNKEEHEYSTYCNQK